MNSFGIIYTCESGLYTQNLDNKLYASIIDGVLI